MYDVSSVSTRGRKRDERMSNAKPNILWICSDQQRWDTLGCYGNRFVQSPNLEQKGEMLLRLCNRMAWTVDPLPERRADW